MKKVLHEIPLRNVRVRDDFWSPRQKIIADVTVPYMHRILLDEVEGAEKSHAIRNFRIAAGMEKGEHYGMVFQDSDVYKWLEAASYCQMLYPDTELEKSMTEIIRIISLAQQPDGYINTYFILREPDNRWKNLLECHELYCAGHLMEAAVARKEAQDKDDLLAVAERCADSVINACADDGIPGHQEIEIGLLRLFSVTGKKKYLEMACKFIDRRGQDPEWFAKNTPEHTSVHYGGYDIDKGDNIYNQSYAPVRDQNEAVGHAVRCLYMLCAMADAAGKNGDETLYIACNRILDDIVDKKMYITGGLGAAAYHESFGKAWELPNDTAYNETCASVAMAFFMQKMLACSPKARYADLLERELYNGALVGMHLDGQSFFYVNPLYAEEGVTGKTEETSHVLIRRPQWYSCACCPTNLARLIVSLGRFLWHEGDGELYSHLQIGNDARTSFADIRLTSELPWNSRAVYRLSNVKKAKFVFNIRVPSWAEHTRLFVNDAERDCCITNGYACLQGPWKDGDEIKIEMDMPPVFYRAPAAVKDDIGCAALIRGPLVYCIEQQDHAEPLRGYSVNSLGAVKVGEYSKELLSGIRLLYTAGYDHTGKNTLLTFIPYYAWANREKNGMRVFVPEKI